MVVVGVGVGVCLVRNVCRTHMRCEIDDAKRENKVVVVVVVVVIQIQKK